MLKVVGDNFSFVWMAEGIIYHITPQHLDITYAELSTEHFCKGYEIRLGKNWLSILAERIVPSIEITDGVMNLRLIMMDMGCAVYDLVYVIKSLWMSEACVTFFFLSQLDCGSVVGIYYLVLK